MHMNFHFDRYNLKIYFVKFILRSNSWNFSIALETRDGDDM